MSDNTSQLIRTNPRYGNVRLVISNGSLYMDSLLAKGLLANNNFKRIKLNPTSKYSRDVSDFLTGIVNKDIYDLNIDPTDVDYIDTGMDKQYHQRFESGISIENDNNYPLPFTAFAPLWIDKTIPEYYVVFSIPANVEKYEIITGINLIGDNYFTSDGAFSINGNNHNGGEKIYVANTTSVFTTTTSPMKMILPPSQRFSFADLVKYAKIVKTFDIKNGVLGEYLRSHINDPSYEHLPLNVDFEESKISYHGISIDNNSMGFTDNVIPDEFDGDQTVTRFDDYVNSGYERNRLISSNLLNISFNFDDDINDELSINSYFGLYLTYEELFKYGVDIGNTSDNDSLKGDYIPLNYGSKIIDQTGIQIGLKRTANSIGLPLHDYDATTLYCVNNDKLILLDNTNCNENTLKTKEISLDNRHIRNVTDVINKKGYKNQIDGAAAMIISVSEDYQFNYGDEIKFTVDNKELSIIADYLPNIDGFSSGMNNRWLFHPDKQKIAGAIRGAINHVLKLNGIAMVAAVVGDYNVVIQSLSPGITETNRIKLIDYPQDSLVLIQEYSGGSTSGARFTISVEDMVDINMGDYVEVINKKYVPISSICYYLDNPIYDVNGNISEYEEWDKKMVITADSGRILIKNNSVSIINDPLVSVGLMDIIPVRDFSFSTETGRYNNYDTEYKKYYNSNGKIIPGVIYKILIKRLIPDSVITYNSVELLGESTFVGIDGEPFVYGPNNSFIVIDTRYESDDEVLSFNGFYRPGNFNTLGEDGLLYKFDNLSGISDEYDRLYESIDPGYYLESKLDPHRSQWRMINCSDVRNNPYRLNMSISMGVNNFSPSFDMEKNSGVFSHEWYYMVGQPQFPEFRLSNNSFYLNRGEFLIDDYLDSERDYFRDYLSVRAFEYIDPLTSNQIRRETYNRNAYSLIEIDNSGRYCTFFRGVFFKFQSEFNLEGYKFSSVLKIENTKQLVRQKPVRYDQYINKDHKNVILIITVVIDDYKIANAINFYEYSYLYMMDSMRSIAEDGSYISGKKFQFPQSDVNRVITDDSGNLVAAANTFYGIQLYNKLTYGGANNVNHMVFDDYIPINKLINGFQTGEFPRLIAMDEMRFLAITQEDGRIDDDNQIINNVSTFNGVIDAITLSLNPNGVFISQLPIGTLGASYNPHFVSTTAYTSILNSFWFVEDGGDAYYQEISKLLSAARIFDNMPDNKDGLLSRYTIENGEMVNMDSVLISPQKPNKITLATIKKSTIKNGENGDYTIKTDINTKPISLYRYSGNYMPMMYDVIKFRGKRYLPIDGMLDDIDYPWVGENKPDQEFWSTRPTSLWSTRNGKLSGELWVRKPNMEEASNQLNDIGTETDYLGDYLNGNFTFVDNEENGKINHYWIQKISLLDNHGITPNDGLNKPFTDKVSIKEINKNYLDNGFIKPRYSNVKHNGVEYIQGWEYMEMLKNSIGQLVNIPDDIVLEVAQKYVTVEYKSNTLASLKISTIDLITDLLITDLKNNIADILYFAEITDDYVENIIKSVIIPNVHIERALAYSHTTKTNDAQSIITIEDDFNTTSLLSRGYRKSSGLTINQDQFLDIRETTEASYRMDNRMTEKISLRLYLVNAIKNK